VAAGGADLKIAYFTAGTIGAGHLVRGLAIERALARAGFAGEYRMFGPQRPFPVVDRPTHQVVPLLPAQLTDPRRARISDLALALHRYCPDLLIVDMFWAPLRHILPLPECECWLIVRHCPPVWFIGPPRTPFAPEQFDRIIAIEPSTHAVVQEHIDPIVIANPDECRPRSALRERLRVPREERLVAVVHAGIGGECERLLRLAETGTPCVFNLFREDALFPIAEWLGGADVILAGAGYNTFWEAHWLGYAKHTRFTAFQRAMDNQEWRLATCAGTVMHANGADTLAHAILH
jgi:hypothetical protein